MNLVREFKWSLLIALLALVLAYMWAGTLGLFAAAILIVLETSLSFDNAVVNAKVLAKMSPVWQRRFLTWGMLIAVFGMRVLFPLMMVSFVAHLSISDTLGLALNAPEEYAAHLTSAHIQIAAFGGIFLLMVFLDFMFDHEKELHWLGFVEAPLARIGNIQFIEMVLALVVLVGLTQYLPAADQLNAMVSGISGLVLYVILNSLNSFMEDSMKVTGNMASAGLTSFLYLEVLDASFSFDGVIGAFAITNDVVIIMLGLGVGALFVRSMTISLVRHGTLNEYIYLSHGAHYAVGALAVIMLTSLFRHVPEVITGLIGLVFILAGLWSSVRHRRLIAA